MKEKLSFTLDASVIAAVRKFASEDARPISMSSAISILLKEALAVHGIVPEDVPATKPAKGKGGK